MKVENFTLVKGKTVNLHGDNGNPVVGSHAKNPLRRADNTDRQTENKTKLG